MFKYFLLWFPMIFIAILNGTARDLGYKKYLPDLLARQLSTISLVVLLGGYIFFIIKKFPPQTASHAFLIGLFWLVLTLGFEFGFGLYRGNSWTQLLAEYNILKGRLWLLIPIWVLFAPYLFFQLTKN